MKNFWIMTVANPWCDLLLRGLKTMELRKRVPELQVGDVILVCRKGGGSVIVGAFRLTDLCFYSVNYLCQKEKFIQHRVKDDEIKKYANGSSCLFGLRLSRIRFDENIKIEDFGFKRNPQNFVRIKPDFWYNIPLEITKGECIL